MDEISLEFLITVGTAIGGIYVFFRGISEYRANTRIKRAEFLDKLISEFLNPEIDIARGLLDDYVYVSKDNRDKSPTEQKELSKPLSTFLRDHRIEPIGTVDEIAVRRSFDKLLDFFTRLSYYLRQELISSAELSYFKYYIRKVQDKSEVTSYIRAYYFWDDFAILFKAIDPK